MSRFVNQKLHCVGVVRGGSEHVGTHGAVNMQVKLAGDATEPCPVSNNLAAVTEAMAKEDAFLVDAVEGGLCVDNIDAGIGGRCNCGSDKDGRMMTTYAGELWDSLESRYMTDDSSSKKFLVSNFNNYRMVDSRPVMEQYNELLRILGQYIQHGLKMDESISVSSIIDKLPPSWKDFKHILKHGKDDLSLVQLDSHLRIEKSLRAHDSDKGKGKEVGGPSVNMIEEGKNKHNKQNKGKKRSNKNNSGSSSNKKPKLECWKCGKTGHFKRNCRSGKKNNANAGGSGKGSKDHSQDQDSGATTHVCKDRCWFKTFKPMKDGSVLYMGDEHLAHVYGKGSVALEFSSGKSVTLAVVRLSDPKRKTLGEKSIDCIFVGYAQHSKAYRNRFSSIPRPKDIIPNVQESQMDDHTDDIPIEGSRDQVGSQYSYCFSIEEDHRTYNEAMQSQDAAF
ncbi:zinc finger, CCHC-type containing protein [Tanacetum coccineum]|uniref:Zinc finger, CCHC-type containing protein n=1 Tax=Tanacetum coccineum TaxID=301880 RepID=A0ABQ5HLE7_9ASTR